MIIKAKVNNLPKHDISEYGKYIVARIDEYERKLWYYGVYDTPEKASEVAIEIGNGIVLEADYGITV